MTELSTCPAHIFVIPPSFFILTIPVKLSRTLPPHSHIVATSLTIEMRKVFLCTYPFCQHMNEWVRTVGEETRGKDDDNHRAHYVLDDPSLQVISWGTVFDSPAETPGVGGGGVQPTLIINHTYQPLHYNCICCFPVNGYGLSNYTSLPVRH